MPQKFEDFLEIKEQLVNILFKKIYELLKEKKVVRVNCEYKLMMSIYVLIFAISIDFSFYRKNVEKLGLVLLLFLLVFSFVLTILWLYLKKRAKERKDTYPEFETNNHFYKEFSSYSCESKKILFEINEIINRYCSSNSIKLNPKKLEEAIEVFLKIDTKKNLNLAKLFSSIFGTIVGGLIINGIIANNSFFYLVIFAIFIVVCIYIFMDEASLQWKIVFVPFHYRNTLVTRIISHYLEHYHEIQNYEKKISF